MTTIEIEHFLNRSSETVTSTSDIFSFKDSSDEWNEEEECEEEVNKIGPEFTECKKVINQHILYNYGRETFPGKITHLTEEGANISCME